MDTSQYTVVNYHRKRTVEAETKDFGLIESNAVTHEGKQYDDVG